MNNEDKLRPELRFPEFVNDGEWVSRNDCVKILSGVSYKMSEYTPKGTRLVQGANIYNGHYSDESTIYINDKTDFKGHITVNKGDILLGLNRPITQDALKVCLYPFEVGYLYQRAGVLKYQDDIFRDFLYQFLCSPLFLVHLKKELVGSDQPYIKSNLFATNILITPKSFKEQQKIASCLSSLDEVIAAHTQKLDLLKDHKKGLMQNLFPQEGETVPKVRFKEFEDDGDWVETNVEKLIKENILFAPKDGNHGNIHPKSSDYVKTGIPFIMASDIKNGIVDFTKCAYLKKEQADSLQKGFAKLGDVLLTHKGTVGEVALINELEFPYIMLTPQVTYYRVKEKLKLDNNYLATFFRSDSFRKNLLSVAGGGTRAYVGITEQQKLGIVFPENIHEQQKIASCLSSLDALIIAQAEKIAQLKLHKKGLMQGLFPKMSEL
jgi:type I restriction enzyme, S subunit